MSTTAVPVATPGSSFDEEVEVRRGDGDADYGSGWFCVRTDAFPCPASGCGFVAGYMTGAHLIVVWPRVDDPSLLANASHAGVLGRNPRVCEYQPAFGRCVAWDEWVRLGRPVHGLLERPEGWEDRPSRL